ncbi:MAG: hypothetical protein Q9223_003726 [Gallowayella weberi]
MFGPFRATSPLSGGLLWKIPFRLSPPQKARQRKRLRCVDTVISVLDTALKKQGSSVKEVERWKAEMPREEEMRPKDKYTVFDRKEKRYRKGVHKAIGMVEKGEKSGWMDGKIMNVLTSGYVQKYRSGRELASGSILLGFELRMVYTYMSICGAFCLGIGSRAKSTANGTEEFKMGYSQKYIATALSYKGRRSGQ